ncbi:uncharacterized mitochondrial protein AtMg00820-like [Humulus lupulus]|uniref:uncharacterized mitochondrial protein AtMg00820-like n=1 Tax=Humulus lupulus TaxID=3486 RepID=UPI002B400A6D|nr:uncharacterized mitochondrial protein AtMg00820-like [Humulus lupulus]
MPSSIQGTHTKEPSMYPSNILSHYRHAPTSTHHMKTRIKAGVAKLKASISSKHPLSIETGPPEPSTVRQALQTPTWRQAMSNEYEAPMKNGTWSFFPPPSNHTTVGNKWVFKTKYNPDCTINKHKACLVAKGFHQTPGVDFYETCSPIIKPATIRIFLTTAVHFG